MYIVPVATNKQKTQIIVNENCAGLSLYPKNNTSVIPFNEFINSAEVRVELVRKSQPNSVLYTMTLKALFEIWGGFGKSPKGVVIPFALKDNLLLSKDSYLQIDITWGVALIGIEEISVQKNTLATSTNAPISFKKIEIAGEEEIDTEHFAYVFIPDTINKIETFVDVLTKDFVKKGGSNAISNASSIAGRGVATPPATKNDTSVNTGSCCCDGQVKTQKIEMDWAYMSYMSTLPTDENVLFQTEPNQTIKFFGNGTVTLMQA